MPSFAFAIVAHFALGPVGDQLGTTFARFSQAGRYGAKTGSRVVCWASV